MSEKIKIRKEQAHYIPNDKLTKVYIGNHIVEAITIQNASNTIHNYKKISKDGNLITGGRLAPKTILDHHRVISKILSTAVKWGLLEKNVAERADPPKVPHREIRYLNEKEVRQMITLLVYTGIRRGELCGLEWKDIDFQN